MNDYRHFSAEQFAQDPYFRQWVLHPDTETDLFWSHWLTLHPSKKEAVISAKVQIIAFEELFGNQFLQSDIDKEIALLQLKASIHTPINSPGWQRLIPYLAACLVLIGIGAYYLTTFFSNKPEIASHIPLTEEQWVSRTNETAIPQTILLSDGSEIILGENSSIRYLTDYRNSDNRQVHLTGSAFFDIAKDSLHPFLVYAGSTVTRVLGTSFRIQSIDDIVEVRVATGKVAVHRLKEFEKYSANTSHSIPGVILSPQDKAVFESIQDTFKTSRLTTNDEVIIPRTEFETDYIDTPISAILEQLSIAYQVPIYYDKEALQHCHINTTFKDESLLQKVRLICLAIGTNYRIENGNIIIDTATCQ